MLIIEFEFGMFEMKSQILWWVNWKIIIGILTIDYKEKRYWNCLKTVIFKEHNKSIKILSLVPISMCLWMLFIFASSLLFVVDSPTSSFFRKPTWYSSTASFFNCCSKFIYMALSKDSVHLQLEQSCAKWHTVVVALVEGGTMKNC